MDNIFDEIQAVEDVIQQVENDFQPQGSKVQLVIDLSVVQPVGNVVLITVKPRFTAPRYTTRNSFPPKFSSNYYYYYYVGTKSDLRQITPSIYPCPASGFAVPL